MLEVVVGLVAQYMSATPPPYLNELGLSHNRARAA